MIPDIFQLVITGLMILIPVALIYKKAGFSPLWAGLVFLPGIGLLLIFLHLSYINWPNQKNNSGEF